MAAHLFRKVKKSNCIDKIASFLLSTKYQGRLIPRTYCGGSQDYKKFIIMCHPRSGSQMLAAMLRQHSQIISFGELFHPQKILFNHREYNDESKPLLLIRNCYPIHFLDHLIFSAYSENIKAVGFKVFHSHLERIPFLPVWGWLNSNEDIKVIFLTRRNLLNTYTSVEKARKTGIYGIKDTSDRDITNVTLSYDRLVRQFKRHCKRNTEALDRLRRHQLFQITYEEIISDYNYNLRSIQNFLEVDFEPLKPLHKKQEVRPLSEVITNYDELRYRFINTEWINLFEI